jgi:hypothetical protein
MGKKEKEKWLQSATKWALKLGIPEDFLKDAEYSEDIYQAVQKWKQKKKIDDQEEKRIRRQLDLLKDTP